MSAFSVTSAERRSDIAPPLGFYVGLQGVRAGMTSLHLGLSEIAAPRSPGSNSRCCGRNSRSHFRYPVCPTRAAVVIAHVARSSTQLPTRGAEDYSSGARTPCHGAGRAIKSILGLGLYLVRLFHPPVAPRAFGFDTNKIWSNRLNPLSNGLDVYYDCVGLNRDVCRTHQVGG
jgi:hypothetical protein